jgi:hypothetical protein
VNGVYQQKYQQFFALGRGQVLISCRARHDQTPLPPAAEKISAWRPVRFTRSEDGEQATTYPLAPPRRIIRIDGKADSASILVLFDPAQGAPRKPGAIWTMVAGRQEETAKEDKSPFS